MHPTTVQLLNQLNQQFYQRIAASFDATRERPWAGWLQLLPYLEVLDANPLRVLDLGCGNGRFAAYLAAHVPIYYHGVDSNAFLLQRATQTLQSHHITGQVVQTDLLAGYHPQATFDVIVMFGLMHHIPGHHNRRQLLEQARGWLKTNGMVIVAFWGFLEQERWQKRIVPWDAEVVPAAYRHLEVEAHDYLLDWRRTFDGEDVEVSPLRYCHYVDTDEATRLTQGWQVMATFEADAANHYWVLRR